MIILKDEDGNTLETCRYENLKRDYKKVITFAIHKQKQTGKKYTIEHRPIR